MQVERWKRAFIGRAHSVEQVWQGGRWYSEQRHKWKEPATATSDDENRFELGGERNQMEEWRLIQPEGDARSRRKKVTKAAKRCKQLYSCLHTGNAQPYAPSRAGHEHAMHASRLPCMHVMTHALMHVKPLVVCQWRVGHAHPHVCTSCS